MPSRARAFGASRVMSWPSNDDLARRGLEQAHHRLDQRRLAHAVAARAGTRPGPARIDQVDVAQHRRRRRSRPSGRESPACRSCQHCLRRRRACPDTPRSRAGRSGRPHRTLDQDAALVQHGHRRARTGARTPCRAPRSESRSCGARCAAAPLSGRARRASSRRRARPAAAASEICISSMPISSHCCWPCDSTPARVVARVRCSLVSSSMSSTRRRAPRR